MPFGRKNRGWSENDVEKALQEVKTGKASIRGCAKKYKMSEGILRYRLRRMENTLPGSGRKPVFDSDTEKNLVQCVSSLCSLGFSPSMCNVLDLVAEYVTANDISTPFKNSRPGYDWLKAFMKRNKLSFKKADMISAARKSATSNPFVVYDFFDVIGRLISEKRLTPSAIWNCDETGLPSDASDLRAIAQVGKKAYKVTAGAGKENTTILAACNAAGMALDPLIIFKGKNFQSTWRGEKALPGTMYACTESGWMTSEVFSSWFDRFAKTIEERPLLLIVDGHLTHVSLQVIELGIKEGITIVKLPPHTTDILQPLDICFSPLKRKWNAVLNDWVDAWGSRVPVRRSVLVNELCTIWHECLNENNVRSGFSASGIFPVDSSKFPTARFDPTLLRRYDLWVSAGRPEVMQEDLALSPTTPKKLKPTNDSPATKMLHLPATANASSTPLSCPVGCVCTSPPEPIKGSQWVLRWVLEPNCTKNTEELILRKIKDAKTGQQQRKRRKVDLKPKVITDVEFAGEIKKVQEKREKKKGGEPLQVRRRGRGRQPRT